MPNSDPEPMSEAAQQFVPGTYRHYKGDLYQATHVGRMESTHQECVAYQAQYGERYHWFRPLVEWNEMVEHEGQRVPRFTLVK